MLNEFRQVSALCICPVRSCVTLWISVLVALAPWEVYIYDVIYRVFAEQVSWGQQSRMDCYLDKRPEGVPKLNWRMAEGGVSVILFGFSPGPKT